jgi:hypothetical protein
LSFLANFDHGGVHYDDNGKIARPAPLGTVRAHDENVYYLGWGGDGHIGRFNISHQFYQAFGHDDFNGLAGHGVDINAQMAALEISYDRDWARYKASFFTRPATITRPTAPPTASTRSWTTRISPAARSASGRARVLTLAARW